MTSKLSLALAGTLFAGALSAQQADTTQIERGMTHYSIKSLATDRPDITESAQTAHWGWFQIETGGAFTSILDINSGVGGWSQGKVYNEETVLRYGVTPKFELRAVINLQHEGYEPLGAGQPYSFTGIEFPTLGFKYNLKEENATWPQITWLSHTSFGILNVGDYLVPEALKTVLHEQRLMLEKDLPGPFSLAANFGIDGVLRGQGGGNGAMQSVALGIDLSNKWGFYIEEFSRGTMSVNYTHFDYYVDGGFTYLYNANTQWDVFAGMGLGAISPFSTGEQQWFVGLGYSHQMFTGLRLFQ